MAVDWNAHRFSGGVLALSVTNTVVHRLDPARRIDRFAEVGEIARFAEAANVFCAAELARPLVVSDPVEIRGKVLSVRETTDRLFRQAVGHGDLDVPRLSEFLIACGKAMTGHDARIGHHEIHPRPLAFEVALAMSALSLLEKDRLRRIKVCPNCDWLFLDQSRNASRLWCDMSVCGNRQKAKRHYRRQHAAEEEQHHG